MTNEELRSLISLRTGIPAELITGETSEELLAGAGELLRWRAAQRANEAQEPKNTREQFGQWMNSQLGRERDEGEADQAIAALDEIRASLKSYPTLNDGGEVSPGPELSSREQFEAWVADKLSWYPGKGPAPKW